MPAKIPSEILQIAALFHDPPWKPWIVAKRLTGSIDSIMIMAVKELGLSGEQALKEISMLMSGAERVHEKHGIMFLGLLASYLKSHGHVDEARALLEAAKIIVTNTSSGTLRSADQEASSLDRLLIYGVLKEHGLERKTIRSFRFANPFNPTILIPDILTRSGGSYELDADTVAGYIVELTRLIEDVLTLKKGSQPVLKPELSGVELLVHSLYLLMEPVWYKSTTRIKGDRQSAMPRLLVPPADTRVPLHTVFDHVNAVLSVINLRDNGCLAIVDLAGVQNWIKESRRTRDLWAASWLASLLAWKSIEPLVVKYGPGVLVSPPGRLHPFYAASVLGWYLEERGEQNPWLYPALGIHATYKWPSIATTPTRYILAIPGEACSNLEQTVRNAYAEAWKDLLGKILESLRSVIDLPGELYDSAVRLEPPMLLRVFKARYGSGPAINIGDRKIREALKYHLTIIELAKEEGKFKISAPGRRTGQAFYHYATTAKKMRGNPRLCQVCGKAPSIITKEMLTSGKARWLARELGDENLCPYCLVKRLLRYVLESDPELAKRLVGMKTTRGSLPRWDTVTNLSTRVKIAMHYYARDLAEAICQLVRRGGGLLDLAEITSGLKFGSEELLEILSSRLARLKDRLPEAARLSACLEELNNKDSPNFYKLYAALYIISEALVSRETLERYTEQALAKDREGAYKVLESLRETVMRVQGVPRRYAFLRADGDMMGKGILSGRLPQRVLENREEKVSSASLEPLQYITVIYNMIEDPEVRSALLKDGVEVFTRAVTEVEKSLSHLLGEGVDSTVTLYVYPSYHMSVSRSLAVMTFLDVDAILRLGGQVIYAGGDDVLALVPPVILETSKEAPPIYSALEAARKLRENWWGIHGIKLGIEEISGFNAITLRKGSSTILLHVAPALAAYGRSTVIYLSDSYSPMWSAVSASQYLEDVKDVFSARLENQDGLGESVWDKDMLLIASDSRGAALTSLYPPAHQANLWRPGASAKAIEAVLESIYASAGKAVSSRLLHVIPEYLRLSEEYARSGRYNESLKLVKYAIQRAREAEEIDPESFLTRLCPARAERILSARKCMELLLRVRLNYDPERLIVHGYPFNASPYLLAVSKKDLRAGVGDMGSYLSSIFAASYVYQSALPSPELFQKLYQDPHGSMGESVHVEVRNR